MIRYNSNLSIAFAGIALAIFVGSASSTAKMADEKPIVIRENTNVCVSVRVDQRVWPTPLLPDAARNFSGFLAGELERLYRNRGGGYYLPGPEQVPRFASNPNGTNPRCQKPGEDIYIIANYVPREDGKPFVFVYRIEQGATVRTDSVIRNIEEEWRSGRLVRIHKQEPLQVAISDDIRSRAEFFIAELTDGESE